MSFWQILFGRPSRPALPPSLPPTDEALMVRAALDAEKRLYESAVAALDQTFAKETLVVTFLTSGALVAVTSAFQACAPLLTGIGWAKAGAPFGLLGASALTLVVGALLAIWLVRGHKIKDLESGTVLLALDPLPETADEVGRQMIVEYEKARIAHIELVDTRVQHLRRVMVVLVLSISLALAAVLTSVGVSVIPKTASQKPSYTEIVRPNPNPAPMPKPAGEGTTLIKGGGGDGTYVAPNERPSTPRSRPQPLPTELPPPIGTGTKIIRG